MAGMLRLDRRRHPAAVAAACTVMVLGLLGSVAVEGPVQAANRKVVIGVPVSPPLMVHIAPYVARDMGFFKKYGIDAELIEFEGGPRGIRALIAGEVHLIGSSSEPIIESIVAGAPVKMVFSYAHKLQSVLISRQEVAGIHDLRGRRMGIVDVGGFSHSLSLAVLERAGIDPNEVQFIQTTTAGRVPALVTGRTDTAIMHYDQALLASRREPSLKILVPFWEVLPNYLYSGYMTSSNLISRDRELLVSVLSALVEAMRFIYTHKDETVGIAVKENSYPADIEAQAWEFLTKAGVWPVNTGLPPQMVEFTVDTLVKTGRIAPNQRPTYQQLVELSLIEEAVRRAGGPWTGDPRWQ